MSDSAPNSANSVAAQGRTGVSAPVGSAWPAKRLHANRGQRVANAIVAALTDLGMVPHTYVMTTRGRKTGKLHRTPVTLVEDQGNQWLVAPYGPVPWVLNVRAAGKITLRRRGRVDMYEVREVPTSEAGFVLKQYVRVAGATRPYFAATKDSPVADFVAEADQHPVFALARIDRPRTG